LLLLPLQPTIFSSIVVNLLLTQLVLDLIGLVGKNEEALQAHSFTPVVIID
jgi:hypothetical protein